MKYFLLCCIAAFTFGCNTGRQVGKPTVASQPESQQLFPNATTGNGNIKDVQNSNFTPAQNKWSTGATIGNYRQPQAAPAPSKKMRRRAVV